MEEEGGQRKIIWNMYWVNSSPVPRGHGPMPMRRPMLHAELMIEDGDTILRVSTMVLKKEGVTSIMMTRLGSVGCLGGSLMVRIMLSEGKSRGRVLEVCSSWIEGVVSGSSSGVGGTLVVWRDAAVLADGPEEGALEDWKVTWELLGVFWAKPPPLALLVPLAGLPLLRGGWRVTRVYSSLSLHSSSEGCMFERRLAKLLSCLRS